MRPPEPGPGQEPPVDAPADSSHRRGSNEQKDQNCGSIQWLTSNLSVEIIRPNVSPVSGTSGPLVVSQDSPLPTFRGNGVGQLACSCGQVLIAGYSPRYFAGFHIRCFGCRELTQVGDWPDDEPLPDFVFVIGREGEYPFQTTVNTHHFALVATESVVERSIELHKATSDRSPVFELSPSGLATLEDTFLRLGSTPYRNARGRARSWSTAKAAERATLAWAMQVATEAMVKGEFHVPSPESTAISYLHQAAHVVRAFSRHPMFSAVARGLFYTEFHHSVAKLTVAQYLMEAGNSVGLSDEETGQGQVPDLFVNFRPDSRFSIEVKAPMALRWPHDPPDADTAVSIVEQQVKAASRQITGEHGGIVVIGSFFADRAWPDVLNTALAYVCENGRVSSRVGAVYGACAYLDEIKHRVNAESDAPWEAGRFVAQPNPRFNRQARIEMDSGRRDPNPS